MGLLHTPNGITLFSLILRVILALGTAEAEPAVLADASSSPIWDILTDDFE